MENKRRYILLVVVALLLSGCSCLFSSDSPLQNESMAVNAETKAKSIDKKKFIDYQVVEQPNTSKELIAVVFNTDSKINLGFIDEYGHVIKEPFLETNYDYHEKLRGDVGVDRYYDKYYAYKSPCKKEYEYYDNNFDKVSLSCREQEEFESNRLLDNRKVDIEEFNAIKENLDKILEKGYETNDYNISHFGNIYRVSFAYCNVGYNILLDDQYELLTPLYFPDKPNLDLFVSPHNNSIVGNFFIKDFGLVYYNTYGDIIWITYCK